MTNRVYKDDISFGVVDEDDEFELCVFNARTVTVSVCEDHSFDYQRASFTMTGEEATQLKEFLIAKGY